MNYFDYMQIFECVKKSLVECSYAQRRPRQWYKTTWQAGVNTPKVLILFFCHELIHDHFGCSTYWFMANSISKMLFDLAGSMELYMNNKQ